MHTETKMAISEVVVGVDGNSFTEKPLHFLIYSVICK